MVKIQVDSNGKAIMLNNKALEATGGGEAEGFLVQVIDYDGTVLKSSRLNTGATFTLPNVPSHNGLVFDGWSSPVTITSNTVTVTNSDITIGPMFHTTSGLSEFDITLTTVTGLNVTLNMSGTKNWGDGTSDTLTTHTYSSVGDYTITCNGSTMTTSGSSGLFGQSYPVINYCVKNVRFGSSVTSIGTYAFYHCDSLASITIPEGVTSIGTNAFSHCDSLKNVTISSSVTSIGDNTFDHCGSVIKYDFSNHTVVPTLSNTNAFTNINQICKIRVPWNLYQEWIVATNWSTYADYIDGGTPATLNFVVTPSNSVIYVNGSQIQGTSTSCMGSTTSYIIYDSINNVVLIGQQTGIAEGATVNITADLTSYNKITLATGVTGLTVTATIDGLTFPMTEESSGNYSINVIGSGTTVDYFIYGGSNYMDASGSITTTGSDITEAVTLTPATELTFTRPNLTADGTLGGSSFAVKDVGAGTSTITYPAWRAVDNSATTYWGGNLPYSGNKIYTFYNPNALKVSELTYTYNSTSYRATAISIQGSNDNSTWEDITSTYSGSSTTYTSALTNSKYYKYYKLTFTPYSSYVRICNLAITATYKAPAS